MTRPLTSPVHNSGLISPAPGPQGPLQADPLPARAGSSLRLLQDSVSDAIRSHQVFELAVRPRSLTPLLFSQYEVGPRPLTPRRL